MSLGERDDFLQPIGRDRINRWARDIYGVPAWALEWEAWEVWWVLDLRDPQLQGA